MRYLGIDIGGTWIKGMVSEVSDTMYFNETLKNSVRVKSPLKVNSTEADLVEAIQVMIERLGLQEENLGGIGVSTAGIVDYAGRKVTRAAAHLKILTCEHWLTALEEKYQCPISIINDADAATIAISELGLLCKNKTVGIMPVGTGLGFSVWRNGRRWRPGKMLTLLGSVRTPVGFFDSIASASELAAVDSENSLINVFTQSSYQEERDEYLQNLVNIINTAAIIYSLDEVMICGGLADAVTSCGYPLESELNSLLSKQTAELGKNIHASVLKEGNTLQLIGAVSLAKGEAIAKASQVSKEYKSISTEIPYQEDLQLQDLSTSDLLHLFWKAEQDAGGWLEKSLPTLEIVVNEIATRVSEGGRIIYVGAGTSGRVAAMDTVEIPCTYGFPEDRILCLIAGGIADAAIEIESDFEEDASAVPEMLFLNIKPEDVVIGISASGTAYYVQSALAMAKERGAYSVMIQSEEARKELPFCNITVPLNAGYEVVAGSTRMKSGTATKKILNFITSSVMIKMGKVEGSYMVDVACINNKLVKRAQEILGILFGLNDQEAYDKLKEADMQLNRAIQNIKQTNQT